MENEIKVGDYIRTEDGKIDKVIIDYKGKCNNANCEHKHVSCRYNYYDEKNIKKHSSNIIDLIEIGDYVNGYKVLEIADSIYKNSKRILIYQNEKEKYERWIYIQEYDGKIHTQDDIKTIVTKEQFEAMEYEV